VKILNLYLGGKREMFCFLKNHQQASRAAGVRKASWKFARGGNLA